MYTSKTDPRRNQVSVSVVPGRAADLAAHVEQSWHKLAKAKPEMGLALTVGTQSGSHLVDWMFPIGPDTLMVSTVDGKTLVLPVEQCTFTFEVFVPTVHMPKRIVGFIPPREHD